MLLRLMSSRCKASILRRQNLHGTSRSFYTLRPDPDADDGSNMSDNMAFQQFLTSLCHRMSQHLRCHIFWAAGNSFTSARSFMYKMMDGTEYPLVFNDEIAPLETLPFDECGEVLIPDPRFIELCHNILTRDGPWECLRYGPWNGYDAKEMLYRFVCRAEKDLFAGEPNVRELQTEMRLFAKEFGARRVKLVSDICRSDQGWSMNYYDQDFIQASEHGYSKAKHARYLYWLKRAQMVAEDGGLDHPDPTVDLETNFVALFNYQLKHAYKIHQKYTYYHVIPGDQLVWSSFQNKNYYTIDVQGLKSAESIEVCYVPALQCLVFSAPGFEWTDFSLPVHADGRNTELILRDGVLTLRVPLHQQFTLDFHDRKQVDVTERTDGHSLELKIPEGVSREDAVVGVIPAEPSLTLSTKTGNIEQACIALPANINTKRITVFLEDGSLTVFAPKFEESDYMAVSLSSRLQVLRNLLVRPSKQ